MSGPDVGPPGAETTESAPAPSVPPRSDEHTAPSAAPAGQPDQGPPSAPWWSASPPNGEADSPDVLVAGPGVPSVDTRRAVPPALRPAQPTAGVAAFASPALQTVTDLPASAADKKQSEQRLLDSPQTIVGMAAMPPGPPPSPPSGPPAEPPSLALEPLPAPEEPRKKRTTLYVALALVPTLVVAGAAYLALSGSGSDQKPAPSGTPMTARTSAAPQPSASSPQAPETTKPPEKPGPLAVDNAKTDPEPLTMTEIFPSKRLDLDGRELVMDRKSLNLRCDYAANGAMARTLVKQKCQGLVRATYITGNKKIGVTVGVVAMPNKKIALAIRKAGTPARKGNWFVALPGEKTKAITRTGGHTALDTYGRYVLYAYAQYLDGTKPAKRPQELAATARSFLAYVNEPLTKR